MRRPTYRKYIAVSVRPQAKTHVLDADAHFDFTQAGSPLTPVQKKAHQGDWRVRASLDPCKLLPVCLVAHVATAARNAIPDTYTRSCPHRAIRPVFW